LKAQNSVQCQKVVQHKPGVAGRFSETIGK
jgi:hypothetical protein